MHTPPPTKQPTTMKKHKEKSEKLFKGNGRNFASFTLYINRKVKTLKNKVIMINVYPIN